MNIKSVKNLFAASALAALVCAPLAAADTTQTGHWTSSSIQVTVDGTSTLHRWTVKSQKASGSVAAPVTEGTKALAPAKGAVQASLTIPAKSLVGEMSGLNSRMYKALKANKHPSIVFTLDHVAVKPASGAKAAAETWETSGKLEISGSTQNVEFPAQVTLNGDGSLDINASTSVKMSDYGIKPPSFMFGAIKSGNEVKVNIKWHLVSAAGK